MEKQKSSSVKRKLILTAFSALVCMLVIGVSVYAALAQTVTLNNNITITTSGQTKVAVAVSEYVNASTDAVTVSPSGDVSWTQKLSKDAATNQAEGNLTPINFSLEDGKNYYAYKFDFTNTSTNEAYAHISATAVDNTQLAVYGGSTWGSLEKLANNTAIAGEVALAATNGTGTYYIVVCSEEPLSDLNDMSSTTFNIAVTIDQTAPAGA